jgi:UDP-2-acetamido-2-deoxy-ribo-hexuluronate aminotransferase
LVPLVDLKAQYLSLRPRIDARVHKVLSEGRYVLGPEVEELEKALATFSGVRHAICVASGTDALKIALMAEGIGPGDAVFVPSFTFVATAEVVAGLGATPVFVDIDKKTFNIDPDDLCRCVEQVRRDDGLQARAVIAVDLFGLPTDYATINEIAGRYGLFVLADAAHSFGGSVLGYRVGGLAPVTATSFYPSKPLGCYGDGGCVLTDDDSRAKIIRSIHRHGFGSDGHSAIHVGVNSRLDTLQAAILLAKLEVFEDELKARERVAHYYGSELGSVVAVPSCPAGFSSAWAVYAILVRDRDSVREALAQAGAATAVYYSAPLHLHPAYASYGNGPGSLPVCERVSQRILSLPMHPYLDEATAGLICQTVIRALS